MVRDPATAEDLAATGAELVVADLRIPETLDAALTGVSAVVSSANPSTPGRRPARERIGAGGPRRPETLAVAPSLAGVLALNRLIASSETDWDTTDTAARFGLGPLRTVEGVLREKAALPVS